MEKIVKWWILAFSWLAVQLHAQAPADSVAPEIRLFNSADALIDSGKYRDALPLLKKAVKLKPDYWEAWNLSADARIRLEEYKEALKDLARAEKIAPSNYPSLKMRGIAHFRLKNFTQAKAALDTAMTIASEELIEDAELHLLRARLMFEGKSYKTALEACESALEFKPGYVEVMVLKGQIRFAMKEHKYAIRDLTEAIEKMKPEKTDYLAYELRAKSRFETGDFKGSVTDWSVFLEANPKSEEALISRGAARIQLNDHSAAISDLDQAIKINGKNPVSYCYRGVAKGGNKSFEEAMKDLDYSIRLKFDYPTAYVNRAAIRMAMKNKRGACEDLQKAESLGSETAIRLIERYCK